MRGGEVLAGDGDDTDGDDGRVLGGDAVPLGAVPGRRCLHRLFQVFRDQRDPPGEGPPRAFRMLIRLRSVLSRNTDLGMWAVVFC